MEKIGLVKYNNVKELANNFWQADTLFMGLLKKENCSFPSDWTETQVMKAIIQAMKNPIEVNMSRGLLNIIGQYNGTKIQVLLNQAKEIHAFPIRINL